MYSIFTLKFNFPNINILSEVGGGNSGPVISTPWI